MTPNGRGSEIRKRERRGTWFAIAGLVVLLGGMYVAGHFLLGNRLPTGTQIGGVGVGGLTPDEAEERLNVDLAPHTRQTLAFYHETREYRIKPKDVGLELNIERSIASAGGGRTWNPVRMLETLVGNDRLDPVVTVDERALDAKIDQIAADIDRSPVEPRVSFDGGKVDVRRGEDGRKVHRRDLEDLIRTQFVQEHEDTAVPVVTARPSVSSAELNEALRGRVKTAVGAPLQVRVAGKRFTLSRGEVRSMLTYVAADGRLTGKVDPDRFGQLVAANTKGIRKAPKPATVAMRSGAPKVVADVPGRGVRTGDAGPRVVKALEQKPAKRRVVELETTERHADFRTADAKKLGINRKVATYSTRFRWGRGVNVGTIASRLNNSFLRTGDKLGFNAAVGRPGGSGGNADGASQVATTLFNAALRAGLGVPERHSHRTYVKRLPAGRDAAVSYGGRDLRLRNGIGNGVLIAASTDARRGRTTVHVEVWSSKRTKVEIDKGPRHHVRKPVRVRKGKRCRQRSGVPGFAVEVRRSVTPDGSKPRRDSFSSKYAPVPRIRCRGRR